MSRVVPRADGGGQGVGITVVRASLLNSAQMATYDHTKHSLMSKLACKDNFYTHFM